MAETVTETETETVWLVGVMKACGAQAASPACNPGGSPGLPEGPKGRPEAAEGCAPPPETSHP